MRVLLLLCCGFGLILNAQHRPSDIHLGDPYVLRVDSTYYMYGTHDYGGFQVWESDDLENWDSLGYAYTRPENSWGTDAFWAPEVHPYQGRYYMMYSAKGPDREAGYKLCLAVADHPAGPFTDLRTPWLSWDGWKTIDAHLFVDRDSVPYLYFNRVGIKGKGKQMWGVIYVVRLSDDLMHAETEPREVVRAEQDWEAADPTYNSNANEGAYVFREGDTYHLTYSSGHYKSPLYGIGLATATSPYGPWRKYDGNPLYSTDKARGISGPGHNSFTTTRDGRRMIVYHVHADPDRPGPDRTVRIEPFTLPTDGRQGVRE